MSTLREYWRVPFYVMGPVALIAVISVSSWAAIICASVGVLAGGAYLVSLRIPDWLAERGAREIRRNQERRRA
jgi:hypothetical protein